MSRRNTSLVVAASIFGLVAQDLHCRAPWEGGAAEVEESSLLQLSGVTARRSYGSLAGTASEGSSGAPAAFVPSASATTAESSATATVVTTAAVAPDAPSASASATATAGAATLAKTAAELAAELAAEPAAVAAAEPRGAAATAAEPLAAAATAAKPAAEASATAAATPGLGPSLKSLLVAMNFTALLQESSELSVKVNEGRASLVSGMAQILAGMLESARSPPSGERLDEVRLRAALNGTIKLWTSAAALLENLGSAMTTSTNLTSFPAAQSFGGIVDLTTEIVNDLEEFRSNIKQSSTTTPQNVPVRRLSLMALDGTEALTEAFMSVRPLSPQQICRNSKRVARDAAEATARFSSILLGFLGNLSADIAALKTDEVVLGELRTMQVSFSSTISEAKEFCLASNNATASLAEALQDGIDVSREVAGMHEKSTAVQPWCGGITWATALMIVPLAL